ncbi:flagella synthesis protein FlgN [Cellvibrio sp.]|uniref:flagella synthesis protein FlgN n=1 Tax=Cellvibrio sp. TaxID=1965322 RepID=UPI0039647DD6
MSLNIQFLRDMLAQDTSAIQELKGLLMKERELLEQRQLDGMQEIVSQKDHLLGNLSYTARQREQLLRSTGLTTDLAGWKMFLERDALTISLIPAWESLTAEFAECQAANEVNGKMINRSKQTLSHLLNLIRGQVAAPSLYTQKGATTNYGTSHTVAKA